MKYSKGARSAALLTAIIRSMSKRGRDGKATRFWRKTVIDL